MTDEKLVKDAAKAIYETRDDAYDLDAWEQMDSTQQERYTCDARAALAVFEKAHTPTDDEREALIEVMRNAPTHGNVVVRYDEAADAILAAGFRRSEVPEPSAECCDVPGGPERCGDCPLDRSEQQGEPSDVLLSKVSINGVRQTWQQLYEREHEAHVALQGYRTLLADLDRNASGRHEGDYDSYATGNGGISAGNPHLTTGQVIGYDISGREYVVPEPRERGTLSAWVRAAGGVR